MSVLLAQGLDVPNFLKDVPNFLKDIHKVPMSISGWGTISNHFLRILKEINGP